MDNEEGPDTLGDQVIAELRDWREKNPGQWATIRIPGEELDVLLARCDELALSKMVSAS